MREGKILQCIDAENLRKLVNKANELGILKDDIVQLFYLRENIYLLYYK